ncbi:hypothetical protein T10_10342 [Trichinella papuae]|uniref:Uncharacterized protein n=1 Tax=Trichinella papuae TaxID=268474 RepID=A0A0V1MDA7_9BILA|nr:hypothetical protein T10_10342 [Trichinella papuae]
MPAPIDCRVGHFGAAVIVRGQFVTEAAHFHKILIELPILIYEVQHTYVNVFMFTSYGLMEAVFRTTRDD